MQKNNGSRFVGYLLLAALGGIVAALPVYFVARAAPQNIDVTLHFQDAQGDPAADAPFTFERRYGGGKHKTSSTARTDADGNKYMPDSPEGLYTIYPGCAEPVQFSVAEGDEVSGQMLIIVEYESCDSPTGMTIIATAYNEFSGDSTFDPPTDTVASGVYVHLRWQDVGQTQTMYYDLFTDANGNATLANAPAGVWRIEAGCGQWIEIRLDDPDQDVFTTKLAYVACRVWLPEVR